MLKPTDHCDRCGARGFVLVGHSTAGGDFHSLVFCGHHYRRFEPWFASRGWIVVDERDRINAKPSPSASV